MTEQEKQNLIRQNYEYGNLDELSKTICKNKHAIQEWARKHGLKRKINILRKGNLTKFLDGSLESFYWLGFHAADGYISKNGHFMLSQSKPEHLQKLAKFLETEIKTIKSGIGYSGKERISYRVAVYDNKIGSQINNMFNIKTKKTYDRISIDFLDSLDKAKSFLIGYTDGDGYINKSNIKLQCHKNWFEVYKELYIKQNKNGCMNIYLEYKKSNNDSYSTARITSSYSRELHQFALKNNLPINEVKWNKLQYPKTPSNS